MPNSYFQFKQFRIDQDKSPLKVTTEGCILGAWAGHNGVNRILDIGTGTGLLALMLAQRYPQAKVEAVEVLSEAFEEAKENFNASNWATRLEVFHQAIQKFEPIEPYDLVVCNPPFFSGSLKSPSNKNNTAKHEGTLSQPELVQVIVSVLKEDGLAFVLYPEREMKVFAEAMRDAGFSQVKKLKVRSKPDGPIFREIVAFSRQKKMIVENELILHYEGGYSPEMIRLLSDYYLNL